MATTDKDYYELLGVSRDADEREIKRAFRRLARQLHPDVSDDPDAESRFREVTEAYEVLSKSETRALYDRYGHAGLRSGGFQPTQFDMGGLGEVFSMFFGEDLFGSGVRGAASRRGGDVAAEVEVDLVDAGTTPVTCPRCAGSGRLQHVSRSVFGEFIRTQACPQCRGRGRVVEHPCGVCRGEGAVLEERELNVEIPPGIHDGQRIRLSGEGHAGALGGRAGDVYVLVRVKPDRRFVREGNDIYSQVDLTIVQAALGATVPVETLDGIVELELPPGVQPGEVRVLRGKGMPVLQGFGRGDHRVLVNVSVPRRLNDEQRRLLKEFEAASDAHTYRHDEGFVQKLKSVFR